MKKASRESWVASFIGRSFNSVCVRLDSLQGLMTDPAAAKPPTHGIAWVQVRVKKRPSAAERGVIAQSVSRLTFRNLTTYVSHLLILEAMANNLIKCKALLTSLQTRSPLTQGFIAIPSRPVETGHIAVRHEYGCGQRFHKFCSK